MRAGIDLDTHIADIVNVIKWEDLANVVLVGHSYGGWVISGVVEQVLPRISSIVYLDAFLPADGQRGVDLQSEQSRAEVLAAAQDGAVSRTGPDAKWFGVAKIEDQAWVNAKLTPQPIGVSLQPLRLTGAREKVVKKTYIRAQSYAQPAFEAAYAQTKADPSWRVYDVPCGHDVMVDMPERLVAMLLDAA
jgi:pimeloyl-ACP methyl ester carboxylesterase